MIYTRLALGLTLVTSLSTLLTEELVAQQAPFSFERIAQERGLSNGTVTAITQGREGFLWFGTQDGLNMYDGTAFSVLRPVPGDTTTLADAWITSLAPSRDGSLWIATLHGGLHRLDASLRHIRQYRHRANDASSLKSDETNTVLEGADGAIWIGTAAGLDRLDPATGNFLHFVTTSAGDSARFSNDVLSLLEVPGGPLWIGTRRKVYLLDRSTYQIRELNLGLRTREIRALLLAKNGTVWVGSVDDLVGVDSRTNRVVRRYTRTSGVEDSPVADGVNALRQSPDGAIWIGSDSGVVSLDPSTGVFDRHKRSIADPRSLGGPIVRSLYVDRGGVLWIGLESYGLSKHAPAAVSFDLLRHDPSAARSLSDGYVRGINQDRAGNIWIATQNGGLDRIDARTGSISAFRHRPGDARSLPGDNVWAFLEDRSGATWVGLHETGFGAFDPATGAFTRSPLIPFDGSIDVVYEDRAGALLVGLEGRGLYEISPDRRSVRSYGATMGDERILVNNDVQAILEDRKGMLWVGGADGLTRIDRATHKVTHFLGMTGKAGSLGSGFVTNIVQDSHGTIWVATKGGGLNRFNDSTGTFATYGTAQGLPHSFVYGVLEDARGKLWLSSDDGIAMFDPKSGLVTRYGLADGLQAREFNRRAHFRASDGTMYFGGINGVNIFQPDALAATPAPPAVSFVALEAGGVNRSAVQLTGDSIITLPRNASAFTISFAALDYTAPDKIRYAYKLEGVDPDWVQAGNRHQATYGTVPTGQYVFRVIAASPAGEWNTRGAAVTFVSLPPWWATWWARALQALLAVGVVLLAMRLRLRTSRHRSAELERRVDEQTRSLTDAQTQLRESLERERESARELVEMTAAVPGAVFQLRETAQGKRSFVFVSEGVARLFPEASAAAVANVDPCETAELLFAHIWPEDRDELERSFASSRETVANWRTDVRWSPAGSKREQWLAIQAHPARHLDDSIVWTGVITDATAARHAEEERLALESKMLHAQKAESLAVLAGGVAHDFNNVLVSVVVGAELLEYQIGENAKAAETVKRIRNAGYRAAELTQQMLAYAGKGRLAVERVNLATIVDEMLALLRATVPRTIELDLRTGTTPAIVEADATQLRQIVMNLITNASEAIGETAGRVTVTVDVEPRAMRELSLLHHATDMPAEGPFVVLDVKDDGCGMDAALIQRIFDPFFTTKFTGRGLGLAALLGIVRKHHGGMNVITAPGQGTRFTIYLPLAEGAAADAPTRPTATPAFTGASARVLVADDEESVRETTLGVLQQAGYEVVLAVDGTDALDAAERSEIDIFLLDVTMPKLNGAAAAKTLRERGVNAPIVLMSGYAEEDLLTRGLTVDADAFLKKPFLASELTAVLRDVMRSRPLRA